MPVTRVDHIDIAVHDLDEYLRLFKAMGFEEIRRTEHYGGAVEVRLPGDSVTFELHKLKMTDNPGVNHIAFAAEDSMAVVEQLKSIGVVFDREAEVTKSTGRRTTNFRDPGGFRLQFTE